MPVLFEKLIKTEAVDRSQARNRFSRKGVYVFYEDLKPTYVGRSQNIPNRVLNHGRPSSGHNSATFAFLLAKEKAQKFGISLKQTRNLLERDPDFREFYLEAKKRVAKMKIKAVEIKDHEIQAIFGIYASKKFKTKYNDFATH
ncbi:MAG: hypothetical protein K9L84_05040 [Candidatus Omnitrophica bacterium]|nr:hypothetical protein [Candidatus Omnitrophota bacterium]